MMNLHVHNWFFILIAFMQFFAAYRCLVLKSPIIGIITLLYAICNILFSFVKGI